MIKILFIINYLKNSGPTRILLNTIKNLDSNMFEINLLTLKNKDDKTLLENIKNKGVNVVNMNFNNNSIIIANIGKIRRIIDDIKPNIVHSHGIIPDLISSKGEHKKICTLHSNINEDYLNFYGKNKGKFFCKIHSRILNKFDLVCCCSESVYNSVKNQIRNATFVRNGIDFEVTNEENNIRNELNIPSDAIIYIYCGRLIPGKRIEELINMFNKSKKDNEYMLVLGTGPLYDSILNYESEQIRVLGFKTDIYKYYLASNIYISNSASEGFSVSVIEALGCGLYLFLSDIPSHKECFNIDKSYYIGEYFSNKDFCEKKERLLNNIDLKNNKKLIAFQSQYLSGKAMTQKYEIMYKSLILNNDN